MDGNKHQDLIESHRSQILKLVDADRLVPVLRAADALSPADLAEVAAARPAGPAGTTAKLLDIISRDKQQFAFKALSVALETTYPHLFAPTLLTASKDPQSLTSDSDEDTPTSPPTQPLEDDPGGGGGGPSTALRGYPHALSHPHPHRPMSVHEISMLKAEIKLVMGDHDSNSGGMLRDELRPARPMLDSKMAELAPRGLPESVSVGGGSSSSSTSGSSNGVGVGAATSSTPVAVAAAATPIAVPATTMPILSERPPAAIFLTGSDRLAAGGHHHHQQHHNHHHLVQQPPQQQQQHHQHQQQQQHPHLQYPHPHLQQHQPHHLQPHHQSPHEKHSGREYERLKSKCDWAENELQALKRQHGETVKKCDKAVHDADLYRHNYKLAKDKIDVLENEILDVKAEHKALVVEKQRYEHEVVELQKLHEQDKIEIEELEKQQREVISESGSSEVLNTMYDTALDKYKIIKQEYDDLRKRFGELSASHNANLGKMEIIQDENSRLRKQYEEVMADLNNAIIERKQLQSQCTAAIMKWQKALHDKAETEKDVFKFRKERDDYKKAHKQAVSDNIKTSKDIGRLRGERDAVMNEYSLVMSERDAVHKEIEQLNDKLADCQKKNDDLEKDKKSLAIEVESLRQEIASALHDRDHALKLLNDARQQQVGVADKAAQDAQGSERELARRDSRDTLERDRLQSSYEQTQKEAAENKDLINKEVEALRKEIEQVQADLSDALSEAELSKRRRDWAFSERDKIVLERESIKTLCDELRRERDRAVSEQAQALRDLDDLKKQKNEATKELKEVREKYEALVEKEARKNQLNSVGHNHSRDSAIDADLQEWETETLELDIGTVSGDDLGFDLCGGKDDPQLPNDNSIFISNVAKTGTAHGKLKINDQLIRVNNIDVTNAEKKVVMQAVRNGGSVINMVVRRRKSSTTRPIQPVHLHLTGSRELGISIESGLYISRILPGSVAAKEGNLAVGDRILNVNGQSVENLSVGEVRRMVEESGDYVVFSVLKYAPTPQPSLGSSSASSGQILTESSPEAPSTSPKSPRSQRWVNPSPDPVSSKSLNIKSSGSQTDSLDSPTGRGRSGLPPPLPTSEPPELDSGEKEPVLCGTARAKIFMDVYSTDASRTVSSSGGGGGGGREHHHHHHHHHHNGELQNTTKNHMLGMIPPPTSSSPPSVDDEAKDVVEEIQAIIKEQQMRTPELLLSKSSAPKQRELLSRREKEMENGGTWPKCRPAFDYPLFNGPTAFIPGVIGPSKKDRPPLPLHMSEHPYLSNSNSVTSPPSQTHMMGKVPPTPPERSDSFNRGKSIKHSPQNSDSMVKYKHDSSGPSNMGSAGAATSKSSPYITSLSHSQSGPSQALSPSPRVALSQPLDLKSLSTALSIERGELDRDHDRDRGDSRKHKSAGLPPHLLFSGGSGSAFPMSSSLGEPLPLPLPPPPQQAPMSSSSTPPYPLSVDTSVRSAQDQMDMVRRPRPHRPTSAPSRGRKERREQAGLAHHTQPQKPTSLPIQPMYSPRPLPLSGGQNIVPTQPLSFRPGFSSPPTIKPTHSSGTPAVGHMVWPKQHPQRSSPSSQPSSLTSPTSSMTSSLVSPTSSLASQPMSPRYTPPNGYTMSRSGNDILSDTDNERMYSLHDHRLNTPSPSPSQQSSSFNQSSQTLSDEFPAFVRGIPPWNAQLGSHELSSDGGCSTLPNVRHHRHHQGDRFAGRTVHSIEKGSERGSPVQKYIYQPKQSNSLPATMRHKRPQVGETRNIHVEKSQGPLGIQIDPSSRSTGGIFVSSVSENSLAASAGIEVGDQLLEVCGINMRKAPYDLAARVLRQCRDSVTMLVQYNPEKYMEEESSDEQSSSDSSANNTPQTSRNHQTSHRAVGSDASTITPQSLSPQSMSPTHSSKPVPAEGNYMPCEPRFVFLSKNSHQDSLGMRFVGGNAVGIFVDSVSPNSSASGPQGLRCGDQLLEFNGANLRTATAEKAHLEISKPTDTRVTILAQYNINKYNAIREQPGDAIYVRALCDYDAEHEGELSFKKDDILFIDNTLYNGMQGDWRAWLVDDEGNKLRSGTIPSKSRLEDTLAQKRSLSDTLHDDELKGSRRGSASARRSFFRRKKHTRNNSKDSRELNSFSDASINSDSVPYLDDGQTMPFQRVERIDCMIHRPVLILGPLSEPLIEKLTSESPDKYCRCKPERVRATQSSLETGQDKGVFLDYQRRDSHYECLRVDTIKEIMDKNRHAMLNCSPEVIERLHKVQIYPIVVFIRHKAPKQIREVKDTRFLPEKLTNKVAKELFEQYQEYEQKYKTVFSEIIPGGNLAYMSVNIKGGIDKHQRKTLWIPAGSI